MYTLPICAACANLKAVTKVCFAQDSCLNTQAPINISKTKNYNPNQEDADFFFFRRSSVKLLDVDSGAATVVQHVQDIL